jgi:serine/threonine-protein kinase
VRPLRQIGRYALYDVIAEGGMATVSFGRLRGGAGFSKTVAIKTLHAELSRDRDFVAMFLDEVRIAARLQHPNIVGVLDVVMEEPELFLVMEYVEGEVLSRLLRTGRETAQVAEPNVAAAIVAAVLRGLHAAHEAKDEDGHPLGIIHRDVSPHNIIVGCDGVARVLDFGVAKVKGRLQSTRRGYVKGKLGYMAPEQIADEDLDRRADIYACGVVLFESLTGETLRDGSDENTVYAQVVGGKVTKPSEVIADLPDGTDELVLKALAKDPEERFATAAEMADELDRVFGGASPREIGDWVEKLSAEMLGVRREVRKLVESDSATDIPASNPESILDSLPESGSGPTSVSNRRPVRIGQTSGSGHSKATVPTVQSIPARDQAKTNRRLWMLAGAAVVLGGLTAIFVLKSDDIETPATGSQRPVEAQSAPTPTTEKAPQATPEPVAPTATTTTTATSDATPPPSASSASRAIKPRPRRPKATSDCDPPYVITKEGDRRYKIECL